MSNVSPNARTAQLPLLLPGRSMVSLFGASALEARLRGGSTRIETLQSHRRWDEEQERAGVGGKWKNHYLSTEGCFRQERGRKGKRQGGGRALLPVKPWNSFGFERDNDRSGDKHWRREIVSASVTLPRYITYYIRVHLISKDTLTTPLNKDEESRGALPLPPECVSLRHVHVCARVSVCMGHATAPCSST
ncbi:unnamed protein product [Pleuronectes platessa]|uniref:Uncharacterized protein n=1 Tax=Pleuronectes platessa TaxID=8262 RepID=A0A9N7TW25_PLEPL|nr:unnamed protein product [Pleuronectes platessa]